MVKHMLISLTVFTLLGVNALVGILIYKELNSPHEETIPSTAMSPEKSDEEKKPMNDIPEEPQGNTLEGVWETEPTFSEDVGKGGVEGTVTWQYNDFVGTKGDVNAKVYLIPTTIDYEKVSLEEIKDYFINGQPLSNARSYFRKVDGYGTYKFSYIPEGSYILLMISFNTFNLDDTLTTEDQTVFPSLFGAHWDWLSDYLQARNHHVESIYINEGELLTKSKDFGYKM